MNQAINQNNKKPETRQNNLKMEKCRWAKVSVKQLYRITGTDNTGLDVTECDRCTEFLYLSFIVCIRIVVCTPYSFPEGHDTMMELFHRYRAQLVCCNCLPTHLNPFHWFNIICVCCKLNCKIWVTKNRRRLSRTGVLLININEFSKTAGTHNF